MPRLLEQERETRLPSATPELAADRKDFRRTLGFVSGIHLFVLVVFFAAAKFQHRPKVEQIVWLDGGMLGGGGITAAAAADPPSAPPPEPEPEPEPVAPPVVKPEPVAPPPPTRDEMALPKATPPPETPKPATAKPATPKPATPKPTTPKAAATPKPATPKPKPKSTPKPQPSPAKPKATPNAEATQLAEKKDANSESQAKPGTPSPARASGTAPGAAAGEGKGKGTAGKGPGAGAPSDFGEYASRLRDKYYAVWVPPSVPDAQSLVVTLKIRVKRDGTVLGQELVKSSGNSLMDGSVLAAAQQVTEIPPLPDGFGRGDVVDIPINFKPE